MEGRSPDHDPLPPLDEPGDPGLAGSFAEGVKKVLLAGVGALFLGEEGARRIARDWKLPKDLANFVAQQAGGAKDELLRAFGDEFRRFLESEAVRREIVKALSENAIEIHAEIRMRPTGEGAPAPEVTATVRSKPSSPHRAGKKGDR